MPSPLCLCVAEVVAEVRREFDAARGAPELSIKYLLSDGRTRLKQLREMFDLQR